MTYEERQTIEGLVLAAEALTAAVLDANRNPTVAHVLAVDDARKAAAALLDGATADNPRRPSDPDEYTFHTDPGHGWLEVSRLELQRLGIEGTISAYSYQRAARVFLEEDCDAPRFTEAKKAADGPNSFKFIDRYAETTPIRGFEHYSPTAVVTDKIAHADVNGIGELS